MSGCGLRDNLALATGGAALGGGACFYTGHVYAFVERTTFVGNSANGTANGEGGGLLRVSTSALGQLILVRRRASL